MSTTLLWSGVSVAISTGCLLVLALGDPKRRRAARRTAHPQPAFRFRRAWAGACAAPGLVLMLAGQWPALLVWLGTTAACGWTLAQVLAPRPYADGAARRKCSR